MNVVAFIERLAETDPDTAYAQSGTTDQAKAAKQKTKASITKKLKPQDKKTTFVTESITEWIERLAESDEKCGSCKAPHTKAGMHNAGQPKGQRCYRCGGDSGAKTCQRPANHWPAKPYKKQNFKRAPNRTPLEKWHVRNSSGYD
jgi:hypothetical protein